MRGQVAHTVKGPKFVEGETVMTPDGLKFVVGVSVACTENTSSSSSGSKFVCGTLIDAGGERAQFMQVRKKLNISWICNRINDKNMFYFYCVTQCFSLLSLITHKLKLNVHAL